jgi:membrane associated rhomboid family serine protease
VIPLSDDNPTSRTPVVTIGILALLGAAWVLVQGAGFDATRLAATVCDLGMVPAELTRGRPVGFGIPIGDGLACVIDDYAINWATPVTSMFLHGSWGHLLGNALFFWVFGNNVEDSMGRVRFAVFYLLCGLVAAAAHVAVDPTSPVPTVGASGAISGALGAYMIMYPRVRVRMFFPPLFIFHLPAFFVLAYWFLLQFLEGLPQLLDPTPSIAGGTAVWAHVGGFVAGAVLGRLFEDRALVAKRRAAMYARMGLARPGAAPWSS